MSMFTQHIDEGRYTSTDTVMVMDTDRDMDTDIDMKQGHRQGRTEVNILK
jgi:hypothetical protein